jgi:hypothetical protein
MVEATVFELSPAGAVTVQVVQRTEGGIVRAVASAPAGPSGAVRPCSTPAGLRVRRSAGTRVAASWRS